MINPEEFVDSLGRVGIGFVTGVPDSLLKEVCSSISNRLSIDKHVIAPNEGSAVALAIGHYLAEARPALVYLQNSGLGNAINPLVSMADPLVYAVPMILMIGWRGELDDSGMQIKDEPQHFKQGRITLRLLDVLDIPYVVIDGDTKDIGAVLNHARETAIGRTGPAAIVVRKNAFCTSNTMKNNLAQRYELSREDAIRLIADIIPKDVPIVSTTGMASRELFEIRKRCGAGHHRDFLTVGGMGHASLIATGIAMALPRSRVLCFDGDGALLMHTGGLSISANCTNLIHVVLNNEAHDSVGGQPTKGDVVNLADVARTFGYRFTTTAFGADDVRDGIRFALAKERSAFLEVKCRRGWRKDLIRPDRTPPENKMDFMRFLEH